MPYLKQGETIPAIPKEVLDAAEFYREHKEFWVIPIDEHDTDATLRKIHEFAVAYAVHCRQG